MSGSPTLRRAARIWMTIAAVLGVSRSAAADSFDWRPATPESQGINSRKLDALRNDLARRRTRAFLVVRNDRLVYEWYADGVTADTRQGTASLAKALVGGLSLAVAISDGRIGLDDPAAKYIPEWKDDPKKSKITVRHLGSHTSGLDDAEEKGVRHEDLTGWKGDFWKRRPPRADTRFEGGFAVFDAPEPWGPWTTAFFTEKWDVGPGETASFPTKWMSADGRTVYLVFSGDDHFAVRRATLTIAAAR